MSRKKFLESIRNIAREKRENLSKDRALEILNIYKLES